MKEFIVIMIFILIGILGHLLFPYLYRYYVHRFSTRSTAPYPIALSGWWIMIAVGYFISLFVRHE